MLERIVTVKGLSIRVMRFYHQAKSCWPHNGYVKGTTYYRQYDAINSAGVASTFSTPMKAWAHAKN